MNRLRARRLLVRLRHTRPWLRRQAESALAADDLRLGLRLLLESDDRFAPDPWVLESLVDVHLRLGLADRGLQYLARREQMEDSAELAEQKHKLEHEYERWHRNRARLATVQERPADALHDSLTAVTVTNPTNWTLRVLTDAALAVDKPAAARPAIKTACARRPDDPVPQQLERKLRD